MKRILVVDDDRRMRRTLQIMIERMGLESVAAADATEAREKLSANHFDLVLTDLKMPDASGIDLLEEIRAAHPNLPVILITAYGTIQTAIEAMRKGAADYILKPFDNDSLQLVLRKTLEIERFRAENLFLKEQVGVPWNAAESFLGLPSMHEVAELIARIAPSPSPVLITGETGTGKELAARCVHNRGPRRSALFVPVNCAALPSDLLESELFGHRRGAFTGAEHDRQGKFVVADGGTLFLDEIGDMPVALQAKLLRVLEDGAVEPLGTNERTQVDVRVISATNQNLEQAIAEKRFRSDLYYRLNTFEIHLRPLRERPDDVNVLAPRFLTHFAREIGKGTIQLSAGALALLRGYAWPGNVRELRNLMERAAVLSSGDVVDDQFFGSMIAPGTIAGAEEEDASYQKPGADPPGSLGAAVERYERQLILQALHETHDNKAEASRRLGISERNLWYKLKKHGL